MKALTSISRFSLDGFMNQPQDENPTTYDVVRLSGLSIATGSKVLKPTEVIRLAQENPILIIDEPGYIPKA
jgi:hypothetical protein